MKSDIQALAAQAVQAQQGIARGDIVRSYDFPGSRDDCYVEGVVTERTDERVTIHVTREVWGGKDDQVGARLIVKAPLGVSSFSGEAAVILLSKCKLKGVS